MGTCKYFVFCKVSVLINNTVAYLYLNENLILRPDQEGHIWIFLSRCKQRGCLYTFMANGIEDSEIHLRKYIREVVQWGEICCAKPQSCAWEKRLCSWWSRSSFTNTGAAQQDRASRETTYLLFFKDEQVLSNEVQKVTSMLNGDHFMLTFCESQAPAYWPWHHFSLPQSA